jgi:hypothetical protein
LGLAPASSHAGLIVGTGPLGSFSGTFNYSASDASNATLTVSLTNTSPTSGYLTGFVFNNPANLVTGVSLVPGDPDFDLIGGPGFNNGINGGPYGHFDIGAAVGGNFQGGGTPSLGIPSGGSASFTFNLTGSGLDTLSDYTFLHTRSAPPADGAGRPVFVARFRGFENGGSDKVPDHHNPEPSALVLAGLGLAGLLGQQWRQRRRAA